MWFFAWDILPPILPQLPLDHTFGYVFFANIHRYALYAGGVILSLHILAALQLLINALAVVIND